MTPLRASALHAARRTGGRQRPGARCCRRPARVSCCRRLARAAAGARRARAARRLSARAAAHLGTWKLGGWDFGVRRRQRGALKTAVTVKAAFDTPIQMKPDWADQIRSDQSVPSLSVSPVALAAVDVTLPAGRASGGLLYNTRVCEAVLKQCWCYSAAMAAQDMQTRGACTILVPQSSQL